jgi:uridylate kinase
MNYKRVLLKLSGESLMGKDKYGIDATVVEDFAAQVKEIHEMGVQTAIVIGGGNIFRGVKGTKDGFDRVQGDYMGMLATIINALALGSILEKSGVKTNVLSGLVVQDLVEKMTGNRAICYLESGNVVIIAGGTGNPFFTTDTASALRALEIKADVMLKGTRVDGVYDDDPEKNPKALKFDKISFDEVLSRGLKVMDQTAFALCKENKLPIIVFNMNKKGNLKKVVSGNKIGTIVS